MIKKFRITHDDSTNPLNMIAVISEALEEFGLSIEDAPQTKEEEEASYDGAYMDFEIKVDQAKIYSNLVSIAIEASTAEGIKCEECSQLATNIEVDDPYDIAMNGFTNSKVTLCDFHMTELYEGI